MISGAEGSVLQPKNVGRVVRLADINATAVVGTGGNEYAGGIKVVRFWVAINESPSVQTLVFPPDYKDMISNIQEPLDETRHSLRQWQ